MLLKEESIEKIILEIQFNAIKRLMQRVRSNEHPDKSYIYEKHQKITKIVIYHVEFARISICLST